MTASTEVLSSDPACRVHTPVEQHRSEGRTRIVVAFTAAMMVAELIVGFWSNSLALLADGWHMLTHVGALGLAALAYWYARTRANDPRFTFGTTKLYALAGYTSAAFLICVAVVMAWEGVQRILAPQPVDFGVALPVAVLGLLANLVSVWILDVRGESHEHAHAHDHAHEHTHAHDHNLRAAYFHVLADAATSVFAIVALLAGRYWNVPLLDPLVGIVAAAVIFRWGVGLIRDTLTQLLDLNPSEKTRAAIRSALEKLDGTAVADLHLWSVGPQRLLCVVAVEARSPRTLEEYRQVVLAAAPVHHLTVEVRARA